MKKTAFLLALLPVLMFSQHTIKGTFSPVEDFTYAFLYRATPTSLNYIERGKVDTEGNFTIELDSTVTAGMYKIVYGQPQEDHNFDLIYDAKEDIALTFSLTDGLVFTESNENKLWTSYTKSMELVNMTISNFYTQQSTDEKAFKDIFKTLKDTQQAFEEASKGTMASVFISANEPYIPTEFEDLSTYSKNLKDTYLKHVDFSNTLLQSSDFLTDRVLSYVFSMSANPSNDYYEQQLKNLVAAIGDANQTIKTSLLATVWQHFADMDNADMANYIADTYLLDLAHKTNNTELVDRLTTYKNSAVGEVAKDFPIELTENGKTVKTSLHQLDVSNHYLLIFWSSTCSHCLFELPKVKKFLEDYDPKTIKVVAYGLEDDDVNWKREIQKYPDFIQVIGLGKWNNPLAHEYGIRATPTFILLDKNKRVIGKPETLEDLEAQLKLLK